MNLCNLLVGNKHLDCYPLYFMLLGISKRNIIWKSRYYFTAFCSNSHFFLLW